MFSGTSTNQTKCKLTGQLSTLMVTCWHVWIRTIMMKEFPCFMVPQKWDMQHCCGIPSCGGTVFSSRDYKYVPWCTLLSGCEVFLSIQSSWSNTKYVINHCRLFSGQNCQRCFPVSVSCQQWRLIKSEISTIPNSFLTVQLKLIESKL